MNWLHHFRESWPWIAFNILLLAWVANLYGYAALSDVFLIGSIIIGTVGTVIGLKEHNKNKSPSSIRRS